MTEKTTLSKKGFSADWFLRGALTKIGDAFDKLTGRKWIPSSSLATSELIERMKKLLESEAKAVPGKGIVVPHNIKLKMQWDKFSTDSDTAIAKLENELLTAAADHINDSLYYTYSPLKVEVKPDYFTQGVTLLVSFEKFSGEEHEAASNVTIPAINVKSELPNSPPTRPVGGEIFIARFELNGSRKDRRLEFTIGGRLSVGRTSSSDLMIDDPSVSKIHASLVIDSENCLSVADTGSTNGTFINGERIAYGVARRLAESDRVKFGMVEVIFEHVPQAPAADENDVTEDISAKETVEIGGFEFTSRAASDSALGDHANTLAEKTLDIDPKSTDDLNSDGGSDVESDK